MFATVVAVVTFVVLRRLVVAVASRCARAPFSTGILASLSKQPAAWILSAVGLLPFVMGLSRSQWHQMFEASAAATILIPALTITTLIYSTYEYNFYLDRYHLVDRIAVLVLGLATVVHPFTAVILCTLCYTVQYQFLQPFGGVRIADIGVYAQKTCFPDTVLAAACTVYLSPWIPDGSHLFIVIVVASQAQHYVYSAYDKLRIRWLSISDLRGFVLASCAHGWSSGADALSRLILTMPSRLRHASLVAVLVLESSAVVWGLDVRIAAAGLILLSLFHGAVWVISGINFLFWSALNLLAAVAVYQMEVLTATDIAAFFLLLALSPFLWGPARLAWIDVPVCTSFRLEGETLSGSKVPLYPSHFAPFDFTFSAGKFRYLSNEPLLVDAWGELDDPSVVTHLQAVREYSDLAALAERRGRYFYNRYYCEMFDQFIIRACRRRAIAPVYRLLSCFPFARDWLARTPRWAALLNAQPQSVRVYLDTFMLIDDKPVHVTSSLVRTIEIPSTIKASLSLSRYE